MNRRVLVVDDDLQMVRTLADVLALEGWQADGAASARDALHRVEQRDYAAVIMDIRMPMMDGVEASRHIRRIRPALPVVLMTAFRAERLAAQAEEDGREIIAKPVAVPRLVSLLHCLTGKESSVVRPESDSPSVSDRGTP